MTYFLLLWTVIYNNIAPIFLAAGSGFALGRALKPDQRTVSRLAFYIFSPCLVFTSITRSQLTGADFWQMAAFTWLTILIMAGLALACGVVLRLPRFVVASLVVASVFVNGGNYGLALNQFAYGAEALARAAIYYTFGTMAVYTLGVAVAAWGRQAEGTPPDARRLLRQALVLPTTYALLAGGALRLLGWSLPQPLDRAIGLLGQASVPVMLVLLGIQMAAGGAWTRSRVRLVGVATFLHLVVAPLVGLALAAALGMTGPTRQAAVTEAAMPAAVIATILAVEYELDTALVGSTVVISTLLSPLTLAPLIAYLQG